MNEWVRSKDRLPEFEELVILAVPCEDKRTYTVTVGKLMCHNIEGYTWEVWDGDGSDTELDIPYWKSLPTAPKE